MMPFRFFALLLLSALVQPTVWSQTAATQAERPSEQVDKLFEKMDRTISPGCAVAAMRDGKILYQRGYGMADLDHNVPITAETVFHVASMSKQFTAAAIVMLAQERKLSLDDEVRKYVPELPDFGAPVTLRQLVYHTSGLRDQWELLGLAGWRYSLDLITDDDVLSIMSRQKDLNFPPGSKHMYSNTGYTLLAQVVKRVSGQSFREFTTSRIFQPLGMRNTHFRDDHAEIVKNMAYGYVPAKDTFRISITNFDTVGATSLLTTIEDLALWDENFYNPRVGGPEMIRQMLERGKLSDGEQLDYAFGLVIGKHRGLATVDHAGGDAGYRSDMIRFPDQHFTAVCLCNRADSNPSELTLQVAEIYLAKEMTAADKVGAGSGKTVQLAPEKLAAKVGTYIKAEGGQTLSITLKDDKLHITPGAGEDSYEMNALSENDFRLATAPIDFKFEALKPGGPLRLIVKHGEDKPEVFEAVSPFTPSTSELSSCVGFYYSEEIEPIYVMKIDDGKLVLHTLKNKPDTLRPITPDLFAGSIGTIRFKRNGQSQVSGFVLNADHVRNMRFQKGSGRPERP
jgi:CubicO group peptidase (beta-lactamase class C family)